MTKTLLITGGAGFIGSHVVRLLVNKYPEYQIVNLDKLTYAGNLENLKEIENKTNYAFVKGDILDSSLLSALFEKWDPLFLHKTEFGQEVVRDAFEQKNIPFVVYKSQKRIF